MSFEIGFGLSGIGSVVLLGSLGGGLKIAIEAHGLGRSRRLPLGCAENDADVGGVELQQARRNRFGLDGLIDGGENDDVILGNLNDDTTAGEAGDDFVFALLSLRGGEDGKKEGEEGRDGEIARHDTVTLSRSGFPGSSLSARG